MLKSITMSTEQTETYDGGGESAKQLMSDLREQAAEIATAADKVEIYTADGIVADYVDGDDE